MADGTDEKQAAAGNETRWPETGPSDEITGQGSQGLTSGMELEMKNIETKSGMNPDQPQERVMANDKEQELGFEEEEELEDDGPRGWPARRLRPAMDELAQRRQYNELREHAVAHPDDRLKDRAEAFEGERGGRENRPAY